MTEDRKKDENDKSTCTTSDLPRSTIRNNSEEHSHLDENNTQKKAVDDLPDKDIEIVYAPNSESNQYPQNNETNAGIPIENPSQITETEEKDSQITDVLFAQDKSLKYVSRARKAKLVMTIIILVSSTSIVLYAFNAILNIYKWMAFLLIFYYSFFITIMLFIICTAKHLHYIRVEMSGIYGYRLFAVPNSVIEHNNRAIISVSHLISIPGSLTNSTVIVGTTMSYMVCLFAVWAKSDEWQRNNTGNTHQWIALLLFYVGITGQFITAVWNLERNTLSVIFHYIGVGGQLTLSIAFLLNQNMSAVSILLFIMQWLSAIIFFILSYKLPKKHEDLATVHRISCVCLLSELFCMSISMITFILYIWCMSGDHIMRFLNASDIESKYPVLIVAFYFIYVLIWCICLELSRRFMLVYGFFAVLLPIGLLIITLFGLNAGADAFNTIKLYSVVCAACIGGVARCAKFTLRTVRIFAMVLYAALLINIFEATMTDLSLVDRNHSYTWMYICNSFTSITLIFCANLPYSAYINSSLYNTYVWPLDTEWCIVYTIWNFIFGYNRTCLNNTILWINALIVPLMFMIGKTKYLPFWRTEKGEWAQNRVVVLTLKKMVEFVPVIHFLPFWNVQLCDKDNVTSHDIIFIYILNIVSLICGVFLLYGQFKRLQESEENEGELRQASDGSKYEWSFYQIILVKIKAIQMHYRAGPHPNNSAMNLRGK